LSLHFGFFKKLARFAVDILSGKMNRLASFLKNVGSIDFCAVP
jgi:hypothetical protein